MPLELNSRDRKIKGWQDEELLSLERLALTSDGVAFIMQLLVVTGVFEANNNTDISEMAYVEGRRSIGLEILNLLEGARTNSAGNILERVYGKSGRVLKKMLARINNRRTELEGLDNE